MDQNTSILDLTQTCTELTRQYDFIGCGSIGKTILQKQIPYLQIGKGKGNILLIAGANATDSVSEALLVHFAKDLCHHITLKKQIFRISSSYLYENRSIWILPRLNPDGNSLVRNGADPTCPLYERQLRMNRMKSDFSAWQGNARGVVPALNFGNDFAARRQKYLDMGQPSPLPCGEFPESEPETAALARFIDALSPICLAEFSEGSGSICSNDAKLAKTASELTELPTSDIPAEGVSAWFSQTYHRPALHIVCPNTGIGAYSLSVYNALRAFLFRFPFLFRYNCTE